MSAPVIAGMGISALKEGENPGPEILPQHIDSPPRSPTFRQSAQITRRHVAQKSVSTERIYVFLISWGTTRLKPMIPILASVFFSHKFRDARAGHTGKLSLCPPCVFQSFAYRPPFQIDIPQEIAMRPTLSVLGLL